MSQSSQHSHLRNRVERMGDCASSYPAGCLGVVVGKRTERRRSLIVAIGFLSMADVRLGLLTQHSRSASDYDSGGSGCAKLDHLASDFIARSGSEPRSTYELRRRGLIG